MNKRILIVEDNTQNLYLARFLLEKEGHEVLSARNGMAGIELARTGRPDLILMDIQLPEMDGYEAIRQLKADPETSAIPIVAVTSFAMVGDREKALAIGCAGYIEKPFAPETFAAEVARFFEHR